MYAVIMAGGQGTRLRPLTCDLPKPLAPLCGKPVLEYILDLLCAHQCDHAVLTLMYQGQQIVDHFRGEKYRGIQMDYAFEEKPLGTAGSVKNAANPKEDFLVISGDALCDFDLTAAFEFHKQHRAAATLLVKKVKDTREYGLVCTDAHGAVTGFLEKPSPMYCVSDLANTGIYILSPEVLQLIPTDRPFDFSMDLFPLMLQKGMPLFAYQAEGYWCDIGDIASYISCQKDMLTGKVQCELPKNQLQIDKIIKKYTNSNIKIQPPVYLGENISIEPGCIIEEGTVICDNVSIGSGSKLRGSVLLEGVSLGSGCTCNHSLVCEGAKLGNFTEVFEQAVIGREARIGAHVSIHPGVKIWEHKEVLPGVVLRENLKYGSGHEWVIEEEGLGGELNVEITPQLCLKIGAALGSLKSKGVIGVGSDWSRSASALAQAVLSGIVSAGSDAFDFGACIQTQFDYCCRQSECDFGVFIHINGTHALLTFVQDGSLPLHRSAERKLEGYLNRGETKQALPKEFGQTMDASGIAQLYPSALMRRAACRLEDVSVRLKCSNPVLRELLESVLLRLGCDLGDGVFLSISSDGKRLSAYDHKAGYLSEDFLKAMLCDLHLREEDIAVPFDAPPALDYLAQRDGHRLYRYNHCSCDDTDREARQLARRRPITEDALLMAVELLSLLKKNDLSFYQAACAIPRFATAQRKVETQEPISELFGRLKIQTSKITEGVRLADRLGELLIRPLKNGRGVCIYAQGKDVETAKELCGFYAGLIKGDKAGEE